MTALNALLVYGGGVMKIMLENWVTNAESFRSNGIVITCCFKSMPHFMNRNGYSVTHGEFEDQGNSQTPFVEKQMRTLVNGLRHRGFEERP
ncbi:hypothetical protein TNCV_644791 [Trichonephila clavipes]|nr:hypothetical protein TNCV_644791 [Trichonephila clavipes]